MNNLFTKQFFILLIEFFIFFSPFLHGFTGIVEGILVPLDIGGDWDCGKVSDRHDLEMFFNIYNLLEII